MNSAIECVKKIILANLYLTQRLGRLESRVCETCVALKKLDKYSVSETDARTRRNAFVTSEADRETQYLKLYP